MSWGNTSSGKSDCFGCESRYVGCHSKCKEGIQRDNDHAIKKEMIDKAKTENRMMSAVQKDSFKRNQTTRKSAPMRSTVKDGVA